MNRLVTRVLDPEGAHLAALHRLGDFRDRRILELGCGDGRLTLPIAEEGAFVLAFDPDAEAVERARRSRPAELADRVTYQAASGEQIEVERTSFDLPPQAIPRLKAITRPLVIRERCRLRRLTVA